MRTSKTPDSFQAHQARKRLDQFSTDLETAINHATKFKPYRKTAVIAFHWENDDIGVQLLERELLDVFKSVYGFETESFTIPLIESQFKLLERLVSWSRRSSGEDTLRIFVYSGHAGFAGTVDSRWDLAGKCDQNTGNLQGPKLNWWEVRGYLEQYTGEVCYLFDCCSAGSGALGAYDGAEFMAASTWDQAAVSNVHFSFTRILIDELRRLNGQAETLAGIYARIFRYAQQNQIGAAPIHIPKLNSPSATIGRSRSRPVTRSVDRESYRVLLSIKVREEIPLDFTQWKEWLARNIPANVLSTKVTVEGAFRGSSLLLFTVPIEIWTMMPADDPSYTFIGHVTSHNLLSQPPTQTSALTSTLPMRSGAPSGRENQPPRSPDRKPFGSPGR
ncbi:hypothetical protein N7532_005071 [Penicillium argentinense]|uniref:Caspase domain-containing protein n=1 Tax=Penicillium argentinense TaxID=1131581 RepID=A0A9W9K9M1_9EURO|nr:uncharacterized protein N7532_005071 [Penicillium argentinense]KAJ5098070.1 hypothetical protein N7532_005071 [Penicillium argentinense]